MRVKVFAKVATYLGIKLRLGIVSIEISHTMPKDSAVIVTISQGTMLIKMTLIKTPNTSIKFNPPKIKTFKSTKTQSSYPQS